MIMMMIIGLIVCRFVVVVHAQKRKSTYYVLSQHDVSFFLISFDLFLKHIFSFYCKLRDCIAYPPLHFLKGIQIVIGCRVCQFVREK
jgi:hypothetical protein